MKKIYAIHNDPQPIIVAGKWATEIRKREVRVMTSAEGYAMVRVKGAMPYVCQLKELHFHLPSDAPIRRESGARAHHELTCEASGRAGQEGS